MVYLHFKSKANLYAAAITLAGERFLKAIGHEYSQSFQATGQHWIELLMEESKGYRLLCWLDDHRHPDVRAAVESVRGRLVGVWRDWVGQRTGAHFAPPTRDAVARLIVTVVTGAAAASHQREEASTALALIEPIVEGLEASSASADLHAGE